MSGRPVPVERRFWTKVDKSGECWEWMASRWSSGYGQIRVGARSEAAHRIAYELTHRPVAREMDIDHLCHNKGCVNPDHLRPVTHKQNMENLAGAHRDSSTGYRGVHRLPSGRFRAAVGHNGKTSYAGVHDTAEAAAEAAAALRLRLHSSIKKGV